VLTEDGDDVAVSSAESLDDLFETPTHVGLGQRHDSLDDTRRARLGATKFLTGDESSAPS